MITSTTIIIYLSLTIIDHSIVGGITNQNTLVAVPRFKIDNINILS